MKPKEVIAWECPGCGHRHMWWWPLGQAMSGPITAHCDACKSTTDTTLVRIAERVWVALWPGR